MQISMDTLVEKYTDQITYNDIQSEIQGILNFIAKDNKITLDDLQVFSSSSFINLKKKIIILCEDISFIYKLNGSQKLDFSKKMIIYKIEEYKSSIVDDFLKENTFDDGNTETFKQIIEGFLDLCINQETLEQGFNFLVDIGSNINVVVKRNLKNCCLFGC